MCVAIGQVQKLKHLLPVGMGIFVARTRTILVHRAEVLFVQERTRSCLQHVVVVFIDSKVSFDEDRRTEAKYFCKALYVVLIKNRTGRLAAIGAGAAIDFFEDFFMELMERRIQAPRVNLLQGIQNFPVLLCPVLGQHMMAFQIHSGVKVRRIVPPDYFNTSTPQHINTFLQLFQMKPELYFQVILNFDQAHHLSGGIEIEVGEADILLANE